MKDIFFLDMDETLIDFPKCERENILRVLKGTGCENCEYGAARFHEINDGLWKALERGEIERSTIVTKRFELLFSELKLQADVKRAANDYFEGLGEICYPYDGAKEFILKLASRGRVYITTNGATGIQKRHIALSGFCGLSGVFISDEVGYNKPSFGYVNHVIEGVSGFQAERAVYLGDSLTSDKLCAERMGVDFVLFKNSVPEGYFGYIAKNYEEALCLFEQL